MPARHAFIADDLGMSPEINAAVAECHAARSLHGASLMVDQPFTAEAVTSASAHPDLPIGIHLNYSDARDPGWPRFPWKTGFLPTHRAASDPRHAATFANETRKQFEAYHRTGLPLAFVNGHHHLHVQPVVFDEIRRCLADLYPNFDGWIRLGQSRLLGLPAWPLTAVAELTMHRDPDWDGQKTTHIWGSARPFRMNALSVTRTIARLKDGFHEFYFHPGAKKTKGTSPKLGDDGQDRCRDREALLALSTSL